MKWILVLSTAIGSPNTFQIAEVQSGDDCRKAAMTFDIVATAVAEQRGESAPELYLECKGIPAQKVD